MPCFSNGHGRDGEISLNVVGRILGARIPDAQRAVITATVQHLFTALAYIECVYGLFVTDVAANTLARGQVPAGEVRVGRCREDNVRVV